MLGVLSHVLECSYLFHHVKILRYFFDRKSGCVFYIVHKIVCRVCLSSNVIYNPYIKKIFNVVVNCVMTTMFDSVQLMAQILFI